MWSLQRAQRTLRSFFMNNLASVGGRRVGGQGQQRKD